MYRLKSSRFALSLVSLYACEYSTRDYVRVITRPHRRHVVVRSHGQINLRHFSLL
jgi:hypothetical protein